MTMKTGPEKFRLHGPGPLEAAAAHGEAAAETPPSRAVAAPAPSDVATSATESLTARQLRMARRLAQKHGIEAGSDIEAVRELRRRGIEPFERANMLRLVLPEGEPDAPDAAVHLPQTVSESGPPVPGEGRKAAARGLLRDQLSEIREIERDIARRRRRKLVLLAARLGLFVGLPTLLTGCYYFFIATPLYVTQSEFVIQQAQGAGEPSMSGLFSGTGLATNQDSITVQSYLSSRDAMLRLDADAGFKAYFSRDVIDPIRRLPPDATNEEAFALYDDMVRIGFDPTEGVVRMKVIAADPDTSARYSRLLIDYAEERVDALTQRLRQDQMAGARASYDEAEARMQAAQDRVLELQERLGVLDPMAEQGSVMSQVTNFETQVREKRLELAQLLANRRPNEARVAGVRGDIERLESLISDLRAEMTRTDGEVSSLARMTAQLRVAETDLQTRTALMQQALQQLETARIEVNRQVRYLSLGVAPIPPDEPTYPRALENTALGLLIFSGIYLMVSLTASILREQVSA